MMEGQLACLKKTPWAIVRDAYREYTASLSEEQLLDKWYEGISLAET